jgi:type I restriction enzyme S subunit
VSFPLVSIGEFCLTGSGGTPSRKIPEYFEGNIPWVKSGDLRENIVTQATEFISDEAVKKSSAKIVKEGAILLAMYGATVGRMAILGIEAATNQAVCNIVPDESKAFSKYVYYALLDKVPEFLSNAVGGAQPNISQGIIRETKIPLPPLPAQQRIAAILDKADAIRRKRQQAIQLADEFLRSVFLEMFGDPVTNPKGWEVKTLESIANCQLGKMLSQKAKTGENHKVYLRNANVRWGQIDVSDLLEMDFSEKEQAKFKLIEGDLLVCEGGEVGRCAIWRNQVDNCYYQKALHRVRADLSLVIPEYLQDFFFLMSKANAFSRSISEVTFSHLTAEKLNALEIPLPPIELQREFARRVQKVEGLKVKLKASQAQAEAQFNALSQRAFAGEL